MTAFDGLLVPVLVRELVECLFGVAWPFSRGGIRFWFLRRETIHAECHAHHMAWNGAAEVNRDHLDLSWVYAALTGMPQTGLCIRTKMYSAKLWRLGGPRSRLWHVRVPAADSKMHHSAASFRMEAHQGLHMERKTAGPFHKPSSIQEGGALVTTPTTGPHLPAPS